MRIEHWDVAIDQGRVAARNMLGGSEDYSGVPFFWTQVRECANAYRYFVLLWSALPQLFGKSLRYAGCAMKYDSDGPILHGDDNDPDGSFTACVLRTCAREAGAPIRRRRGNSVILRFGVQVLRL